MAHMSVKSAFFFVCWKYLLPAPPALRHPVQGAPGIQGLSSLLPHAGPLVAWAAVLLFPDLISRFIGTHLSVVC